MAPDVCYLPSLTQEHPLLACVQDLRHWVSGWLDWNMALDLNGGPSWVPNYQDSPIIVNASANEFYKGPMFYAMGHFRLTLPIL